MLRRALLITALISLAASPRAAEEPIQLHASLDGQHEVPPNQSGGSGTLEATLDRATKELTYTVTYSGLSGPATAAHFHGPADPGQNAPVVIPLPAPLTSPVKSTATLTDAQMGDLLAGRWYVNVHSAEHPMGEIRGQVLHGGP